MVAAGYSILKPGKADELRTKSAKDMDARIYNAMYVYHQKEKKGNPDYDWV